MIFYSLINLHKTVCIMYGTHYPLKFEKKMFDLLYSTSFSVIHVLNQIKKILVHLNGLRCNYYKVE